MVTFQQAQAEIIKSVGELTANIKPGTIVTKDFCPGSIIASPVLVTIMSRLGRLLDVEIPDNCYIFHDKKLHKQLSIEEAAQKLIKESKHGK